MIYDVRTKTFVPVIPIRQMADDEINPLIWNDTLAEKVTVLLKLILIVYTLIMIN